MTDAVGDTLATGRLQIHGRGHSTWEKPKRPYNIKLEETASLLLAKPKRRYTLLANYSDPTSLRNLLVLETASLLMPDNPRCRLVELVLDGQQRGLYLLTEGKRKVKDHSLAFCVLDVACCQEVYDEAAMGFISSQGECVALETPDMLSENQLSILKARFDEMERAVASSDGRNPETGRHYTEYIDLQSFALYYIIEEVYLNQDAGMGSFYVTWQTTEENERFVAGPAWDFDLAVGRLENPQHMQRPDVFYARTPIVNYGSKDWDGLLCELWQHADFREEVQLLYTQKVAPLVWTQFEEVRFDSLCQVVLPSTQLDCQIWHRGKSPRKAMRKMRDFMLRRLQFLDRMWTDGEDDRLLNIRVDNGWEVSHHLAEFKLDKGDEFVPPLIDRYRAEEGFVEATPKAWFYEETDSLFTAGTPIMQSTTLRLRWTMSTTMWNQAKRYLRRVLSNLLRWD